MKFLSILVFALSNIATGHTQNKDLHGSMITKGQMPNLTRDKNNIIHIVYGRGDSILYISSKDGKSFTAASLIAVLPKLSASAMRGPQIAAADNGLVVTACTTQGNIFSYRKDPSGKWTKAKKVNEEN